MYILLPSFYTGPQFSAVRKPCIQAQEKYFAAYYDGIGRSFQGIGHLVPAGGIGIYTCYGLRGQEHINKVIINKINVSYPTRRFTGSERYALRLNGVIVWVTQQHNRVNIRDAVHGPRS